MDFLRSKVMAYLFILFGLVFTGLGVVSLFGLADYSAVSDLPDTEFCVQLARRHGVAAIPLSPFCNEPPRARLIRFCFAKDDATLERAAGQLRAIR